MDFIQELLVKLFVNHSDVIMQWTASLVALMFTWLGKIMVDKWHLEKLAKYNELLSDLAIKTVTAVESEVASALRNDGKIDAKEIAAIKAKAYEVFISFVKLHVGEKYAKYINPEVAGHYIESALELYKANTEKK